MEFNAIDIQKFDSTGYYLLNEDYILSYSFSDGWTERWLRISFYIDVIYNCKIDISFAKPNSYKKFETQFEIEVPDDIKNLID